MYDELYNMVGDNFNIEAVCPDYLPESQCVFTWYRDSRGVAVISGYNPYVDPTTDWLCVCGHFEEGGCCCTNCGHEPPWGCIGCGAHDDDYDMDMDFGEFDPYEGTYEPNCDYDGYYTEMNDLLDAINKFCEGFDTWIIEQPESVAMSAGVCFGLEYAGLHELAQKMNAERAVGQGAPMLPGMEG